MIRFGWVCIVVGLLVSAGSALEFLLRYLADPTANDPVMGFLVAVGFGGGIVVATVGGAMVAKANGRWVPPI
jgi:hypothetical protein